MLAMMTFLHVPVATAKSLTAKTTTMNWNFVFLLRNSFAMASNNLRFFPPEIKNQIMYWIARSC